ncbi:hypothetical protein EMCRGX_G030982 [Ephydatia muelleri]
MEKGKDSRLQKLYDKEGRNTSSSDPTMMHSRVFIGNLPSDKLSRQEVEKLFEPYGKILGVSMHRSYGFVQFDSEEAAKEAVRQTNGTVLCGLRLDVNIATERRKEPGRQSRPQTSRPQQRRRVPSRSPSPPPEKYPSYDRYPRSYSPPPPFPPPFRLPYRERSFERDPYYERYPVRDPYYYPRDDPYERHRERPRDYPLYHPPREYSPRDPYEHLPPPPPVPHVDLPPPPPREAERKAKLRWTWRSLWWEETRWSMLLTCKDVLKPTVLDAAARRGLLYVVVVTPQHESHRSVTLTILHGRNPQEHKNMPLDDALGLIAKDFERYISEGRASSSLKRGEGMSSISHLIGKLSANENLSSQELQTVISSLQQQAGSGTSFSSRFYEESRAGAGSDDDPQRQQADLQAKILSLLGSSAALPAPSAPQPSPLFGAGGSSRQQYGRSEGSYNGGGGYRDFAYD